MSARFTAASTQYFTRTGTVMAVPFTVGMWINLAAVGTVARTLWSHSDTGTTNNYWMLRMTASETLSIVARAGGTENVATLTSAILPGTWFYVVARFITATNRRVSEFHGGLGRFQHNQATTSRAPTGVDTTTIGALSTSGGITEPWDGMIAEYFLADIDIQADGAQLDNRTLHHLAYNGPFSIPMIKKNIIEYRSFYSSGALNDGAETYTGPVTNQYWTNTNGVAVGRHPPLHPGYPGPRDVHSIVMI